MLNPSAHPADLIGKDVWFIQNQIHIRSGKVRIVLGMQLVLDTGSALHVLHRRECYATEAAVLRFRSQQLTEEIALRETARTNVLMRLAELGDSQPTLVVIAAACEDCPAVGACDLETGRRFVGDENGDLRIERNGETNGHTDHF